MMSSLGISLILLVALAVVLALAYNLRQSRPRLRWLDTLRGVVSARRAGRVETVAPARGGRGEPRLAASRGADAGGDVGGDAGEERDDDHGAADAGAAQAGSAEGPLDELEVGGVDEGAPRPVLSADYDCIVALELPSPLSGERLIALAQRFRRAGAKPVAADGQSVDAQHGEWGALVPGRHYCTLRLGILLANRHGALNALEFSEFVAGVQEVADALGVLADLPDMSAVLARARELDATCAQLDAQVGINVAAPDALGPAQLAALAPELAVVERGSDRYARLGPSGEVLFSVALGDAPGRLTFLLDVPRAPAASGAWNLMVEAAQACARRLGARLVDDGGRPLGDSALAQIGHQVAQRQSTLDEIGLTAGSALALRVFN